MQNSFLGNIYGHDKTSVILSKICNSNRIPHALLFTGPEGVGKFHVAIQFAKEILLKNNGSSTIEKRIHNLEEPYIKYVMPLPRGKGETNDDSATAKLSKEQLDEIQSHVKIKAQNPFYKISIPKANNIKISSIRDIKKFINFNYEDLRYRFIIIEDAHLMNEEAQNALLKSLEEPPSSIVFILITPYVKRILPTIQSRCWSMSFAPYDNKTLCEILQRYHNTPPDLSEKVALFSNGSVQIAVKLIDNNFEEILKQIIELLRYAMGRRYNKASTILESLVANESNDTIKHLLSFIMEWFSDVARHRECLEIVNFKEYSETIEKFNTRFSNVDLSAMTRRFEVLQNSIDQNINLNLIFLNLIFELSSLSLR